MGFKLGGPSMALGRQGTLNKSMPFKIERKDLEPGVNAEAVDENTMVIDKDIPEGSDVYNKAVAHEAVHCKEMGNGQLAYGDDWVRDGNKTYARRDGEIKYNGKWLPEGDASFPWEQRAIAAEKNA